MKVITREEIQEKIKAERIKLNELNRHIKNLQSKKSYVKSKIKSLNEIPPNQVEMNFNVITF